MPLRIFSIKAIQRNQMQFTQQVLQFAPKAKTFHQFLSVTWLKENAEMAWPIAMGSWRLTVVLFSWTTLVTLIYCYKMYSSSFLFLFGYLLRPLLAIQLRRRVSSYIQWLFSRHWQGGPNSPVRLSSCMLIQRFQKKKNSTAHWKATGLQEK